ncbi:hypothetical protein [Pararhizobium sp. LjRoot238]|uniref:hypothetical protein n=1 Tax=Pararhizobium sp. LjRoot238 TaxID=3342293 RepID=UPI003ED00681
MIFYQKRLFGRIFRAYAQIAGILSVLYGTILLLGCFLAEEEEEHEDGQYQKFANRFHAVARTAHEHPSATSTALLIFGAAAFVAGYLIGSASIPPPQRSRYR